MSHVGGVIQPFITLTLRTRLKLLSRLTLLACLWAINPIDVKSQSPFTDCPSVSERNATLIFPEGVIPTVDGQPISDADELAVFDEEGTCGGAMVWEGPKAAMSIWADDAMTDTKDGFLEGESLLFRVWRKATGRVYTEADSEISIRFADCGNAICRVEKTFQADVVYLMASTELATATNSYEDELAGKAYDVESPYPNPFSDRTSFSVRVREPQSVRIQIYDALGRVVARLHDGPLHDLSEQFTFDASPLPNGVYFINILGEHFSSSRQVTVVH